MCKSLWWLIIGQHSREVETAMPVTVCECGALVASEAALVVASTSIGSLSSLLRRSLHLGRGTSSTEMPHPTSVGSCKIGSRALTQMG